MTVTRHVVVPYAATNSTVRTRALHWIDRLVAVGRMDRSEIALHGPGLDGTKVSAGEPLLLLRNVRRLTRGGAERRLLTRASPGVYDLDDGLPWDDGRLPGLGRWWKRPLPLSLVAARAAAAADRLVVGNEVLAEWGAHRCPDVRIVPTCVEPSEYRVRGSWEIGVQPVIGWIGSPATELYLLDVAPALAEACRRTGARLQMISGDGLIPGPLAPFTTKLRWSPAATTLIADWDVGIMPLHDGVYERAKCGYKLLQYAASGVPAVGSPVGASSAILDAMDGLAPHGGDEWVDALCEVLAEPAERRAERARRGLVVADRYSYDAWQEQWLDAVGW